MPRHLLGIQWKEIPIFAILDPRSIYVILFDTAKLRYGLSLHASREVLDARDIHRRANFGIWNLADLVVAERKPVCLHSSHDQQHGLLSC